MMMSTSWEQMLEGMILQFTKEEGQVVIMYRDVPEPEIYD